MMNTEDDDDQLNDYDKNNNNCEDDISIVCVHFDKRQNQVLLENVNDVESSDDEVICLGDLQEQLERSRSLPSAARPTIHHDLSQLETMVSSETIIDVGLKKSQALKYIPRPSCQDNDCSMIFESRQKRSKKQTRNAHFSKARRLQEQVVEQREEQVVEPRQEHVGEQHQEQVVEQREEQVVDQSPEQVVQQLLEETVVEQESNKSVEFEYSNTPSRSRAQCPHRQERVYVEVAGCPSWKRGRVEEFITEPDQPVKYKIKVNFSGRVVVTGKEVAYWKPLPPTIRMPVGLRVIACPESAQDGPDEYYPGLVRESSTSKNEDRYLVCFDRGEARYISSKRIRVICDGSTNMSSPAVTTSETCISSNISASAAVTTSALITSSSPVRAVARKSTGGRHPSGCPVPAPSTFLVPLPRDSPVPRRLIHHKCGPKCVNWVPVRERDQPIVFTEEGRRRETFFLNPLAYPLLHGWRRKVVTLRKETEVRYTAPCGRVYNQMEDIFQFLRAVGSDMSVDMFDMHPNIRPMAKLAIDEKRILKMDVSNGKTQIPISVFNDIDDSLPENFHYFNKYFGDPGTDPQFLSTCQCEDDCRDDRNCACSQVTLREMEKIFSKKRRNCADADDTYNYRRLFKRIETGVFECNRGCRCSSSCLNRVAQNPLQLELQVFKTRDKGWGVRSLHDIPLGTFICLYAGDLLSNESANKEGDEHGDEYFVDLDYREVAEKATHKEGFESEALENIPMVVNAKHRGNVSRFFNHSCEPNMFAQNVFIDTHDLNVPRVALFAGMHIPAGTELTWHYGYTHNSVPGKSMKCNCQSKKCDGRLL